MEVGNRSASENNLLLNYDKRKQNSSRTYSTEDDVHLSSREAASESSFDGGVSHQRNEDVWRVFKPTNDCTLRHRGFAKFKRENTKKVLAARHGLGGLPCSAGVERSSDCCSDGEGCHADCESPTSDEEETARRDKKSGLKVSSRRDTSEWRARRV